MEKIAETAEETKDELSDEKRFHFTPTKHVIRDDGETLMELANHIAEEIGAKIFGSVQCSDK